MDALHVANNRLYDQPYVVSVADHTYFDDLRDRIRKLDYEGPLPDVLAMGAWRKCWDLWEELQRRPKVQFTPSVPDKFALLQESAKRLRDERQFLRNLLDREKYTEADLGLQPGDLTTVDIDNDGLYKISSRVSAVYDQLRPLTSDQTRIFFLEKRVLKLEAALAAKL
jgi:hypothetical protein